VFLDSNSNTHKKHLIRFVYCIIKIKELINTLLEDLILVSLELDNIFEDLVYDWLDGNSKISRN
jgi:hypothetical protein